MELKRLGKYQIIKLLGEGGFGTVYLAEDNIGRQVALKVLHPQIASDKLLAAYFEREAVALARLKHPNIVAISSYDQAEGTTFIEMEYVEGRTLRDILLQDEPLPLPQILKIFLQILDALSHAHAKGVIHRDIKPANIMLTPKGEVKITDFGIARVAGSEKLTQTGTGAGSLLYMSPEQIKGKGIDHRSDLYSLAISLYQVLTGKTPFSGDSDYEIMNQQLKESPPPLRQIKPDIPGELEFLILKALEKDKEDRFQSAAEMATELERVAAAPVGDVRTTEETILPRPKMRAPLPDLRRSPLWPKLAVGLAGVAVVVVAVLLLYPLGGDREEGEREGLIQQEIGITFADSLGSVIKMFNDGDYHGSFDLAKSLKESASANREDRLRLRKILAASALITGDSLAADREFSRLLADFANADFSRDEYPPEVVARWQYIRKPPVTAGDDQIANGTETGSGTETISVTINNWEFFQPLAVELDGIRESYEGDALAFTPSSGNKIYEIRLFADIGRFTDTVSFHGRPRAKEINLSTADHTLTVWAEDVNAPEENVLALVYVDNDLVINKTDNTPCQTACRVTGLYGGPHKVAVSDESREILDSPRYLILTADQSVGFQVRSK